MFLGKISKFQKIKHEIFNKFARIFLYMKNTSKPRFFVFVQSRQFLNHDHPESLLSTRGLPLIALVEHKSQMSSTSKLQEPFLEISRIQKFQNRPLRLINKNIQF